MLTETLQKAQKEATC